MTRPSPTLIGILVIGLIGSLAARAETPIPQQGQLAPVNGIQLYYEAYGEGPPLVLLHNFGSSGAAWAPLVPEFAKAYHVIVPDLRGHGHSTNPSGQFTHRQAALARFFPATYEVAPPTSFERKPKAAHRVVGLVILHTDMIRRFSLPSILNAWTFT